MVRAALLKLVLFYRRFISPLKPRTCRFVPTCSHYAYDALAVHGVCRGLPLIARRLVCCGPWHPGGFDPVPDKLSKRG